MSNLYKRLIGLLPQTPLQIGDVVAFSNEMVIIELPGGGQIQARGSAQIGSRVFVRDGVIEGLAPSMPIEIIEV